MILFASKLYSHRVGSFTGAKAGSVRYLINVIAMFVSMVEPPTPPTANGGRPPATPFVGEAGRSGITIAGDILSTCRLPGPIEFGHPGRGSKSAIAWPKTRPRLVTPTCVPKPPPMLNVKATQLPH